MNLHSLLIFLHVAGGVGIFVALGIEAVGLSRLRRADDRADAATWMAVLALAARVAPVAMLTMLASGIVMMIDTWGPQPWIQVALAAVIVMLAAAGFVAGRAQRRLREALADEAGAGLAAARGAIAALTVSLRFRAAVGTGILGLMTIKPALPLSLFIMAAALAPGLVASLPVVVGRLADEDARGVPRVGAEDSPR